MKRGIGILLILVAVALGVLGVRALDDSKSPVIELGDIEITAEDQGEKDNAYVYFGLSALGLIVGLALLYRKKAIA